MASQSVCVETSTDNAIIEVAYDGTEILQPPLSLGEHLAKQASKIDFSNTTIEDEKMEQDQESDESGESSESEDSPTDGKTDWPWENVRNKLKDALTELSVLSDVLAVSSKELKDHKRYMILDGPFKADAHDLRPYACLVAKKKSLDGPARILLQGAENLKHIASSTPDGTSAGGASAGSESIKDATNEFHIELLRLRQNWRLKKVSNNILGDLSYRTAGSHFKQSGVFEVTKAASTAASTPAAEGEEKRSALNVTVPSELEGIAFIQVTIQKESDQMMNANLTSFTNLPGSSFGNGSPNNSGNTSQEVHWQKKLEQAQNVLFCKELFAQLAKEAIQLKATIPHMVVGTQIIASLFTDIQLIISLCHSSSSDRSKRSMEETSKNSGKDGSNSSNQQQSSQSQKDHSHVLEHSLHQLLRQTHARNINPEGPSLSSAPVGVSKKRRIAGPSACDRQSLLEMAKHETILERVIAQAQHVVLRLRTMFVLDTIGRDMKDPLITCHWSTLSSPTCTSVKVMIVTSGYDSINKTQLFIKVEEKRLTVVCRDGRVLKFSHEPQELRDFILCQIAQHQVNGVQALAKVTGWQVISSSSNLGSGVVEPLGNAAGVLLSSPTGDRFISVRPSPITQTSVWVSSAPCKDYFPSAVVKDHKKWENLPESFKEVRLDRMDGKNLLSKLELLMAALVSNVGIS
ncbi:mediator of RNA polymerase II transcription subunit 17 isoform X2 [Lepeophtheirus salmonis]|uniref:mediator of RNA polymerase II transcription subunit 17 isoform X2 n=1 Tax=Lepeophtheirus salmonis TaxID=72036 RepID=UPI001AE2C261|nr:mediator of RNA polymerase II transcription subunit 17-like isoform X2 [Lepeophtheirus salmonis]